MSVYKGFTTVELRKPKRSKFDLSHERRTSTRMGRLVPIFISETIPNDTFRCNSEVMLRLAPLTAPIMHRVNVFVHYFFVPNRIIWEDWENFITGGRLGTETPPVPPNAQIDNILALAQDYLDQGSVMDHLGFGCIGDAAAATFVDRTVDLMPIGAWYKIWYDYYRDRNYEADTDFLPMQSGTTADATLLGELFFPRVRDYQREYFTSAQLTTQRGAEALMPLQGSGTVTYLTETLVKTAAGGVPVDGGIFTEGGTLQTNNPTNDPSRVENIDDVLITNSTVSINDLRVAVALQKWLERNQLSGSRYTESTWANFNRKMSDQSVQRAVYLGGGKMPVKISEVVTTAYSEDSTSETIPPANMAGHGLAFSNTNQFTYNCEEHGFVIGIMSVMPTVGYMSGTNRMFLGRNTFLDYPWPTFAHLGEQEVKKYELWSSATTIPVDRSEQPLFGYQSRYADWKYIRSSVHGDFRSSLDFWHLSRKFSSEPALSAAFCRFEDALQNRVFAVADGTDTLWAYIYNNCTVIRSLPYYGTPQLG